MLSAGVCMHLLREVVDAVQVAKRPPAVFAIVGTVPISAFGKL